MTTNELLLVLLLGHELQVFIAQDLLLHIFDLLLLVLDLLSAPVVLLNNLLISHQIGAPFAGLQLILLADQLLCCITKHALLLTMILELVLVLDTFLGNLSQHEVSLTLTVHAFHLLLLLLE